MKRKHTFWKFLLIMGKSLPLFLFAMTIHMVGDNCLYLTLSYYVNKLVDMAQVGSFDGFWLLTGQCVLYNIIALLVFFLFGVLYDFDAKKGNSYVQKLMINKTFKLPMSYFDANHSGDIVSKIMNDADTASQIFTSRLRRVTTPLLSVIVYLIPMYIISPILATCILIINTLSMIVNKKYVPKMKQQGKEISKSKSNLTKNFLDVVNGRDLFKIFSGTNFLKDRFIRCNEDNARISKKYWDIVAGLGCVNTFFDIVCSLGFLLVSIELVNYKLCTVGGVVAIYTLYGTFSSNFLDLGKYFPELINCIARADVVFDFLDEKEENVHECVDEKLQQYDIAFKNVSFDYNGVKVIDKFTTHFDANRSTAIIGHTGCGKSTLIKLLLRLYDVEDGHIFIGKKDINSFSTYELRNSIAYVPQNIYLFRDTVKENIRCGKPDATDEEVYEAAKKANAHEFIMSLADGYDTFVCDGGKRFSGGEQQRIAIARAFIKNASVLVMDEATSALDNKNEKDVIDAIKTLTKKRTSLIIAHRKNTIEACDNKLSMDI